MVKRFKEEIVKILKEVEAGSPIRDVIRKHNVPEQSYNRKSGTSLSRQGANASPRTF